MKPSKPRKIKITVELDPQDAQAFRDIVKDRDLSCVASALIAMGIRDYRIDPGIGDVLIQRRLNNLEKRASKVRPARKVVRVVKVKNKP